MMADPKTKYLMWFAALILIMACVPTIAAPPSVPTTDPNAISTYIAQTANVAASQTAARLPTSTPTATFTSTPRNTDTPEPTATATVLFLFYTSSPVVLPGTSVASSKRYACDVQSVTPANGTNFGSRASFDAAWKVKNIGVSDWDKNSVDYVYLSGDKFHKVAAYDLGTTMVSGEIRTLVVAMQAPKNPGTYTTNWTLRISAVNFCPMSLTISVK
ncbi:MAG: NBR1-Ig-like domain-containing protein [Chloroflexota bacterium]